MKFGRGGIFVAAMVYLERNPIMTVPPDCIQGVK
jgi:hypothetical protein